MDRRFPRKGSYFSLIRLTNEGGKKKPQAAAPKQQKFTVEDLLAKAEEYVESYDIELAEKFYQRAHEMEPNNTKVLDSYAGLLLEMDDFERAKQVTFNLIQIAYYSHSCLKTVFN